MYGAYEIEGEVAHHRHVGGAVTLAQAREVLAEDDVEHPMEGIFDAPVAAHHISETLGGEGSRGDIVSSFPMAAILEFDGCLDHGDGGELGKSIFAGKAAVPLKPADVG